MTCRAAQAASMPTQLGIRHVLVNGTEIAREGEFTGAVPGRVLHSGRDTATVHAGSDWSGVPA